MFNSQLSACLIISFVLRLELAVTRGITPTLASGLAGNVAQMLDAEPDPGLEPTVITGVTPSTTYGIPSLSEPLSVVESPVILPVDSFAGDLHPQPKAASALTGRDPPACGPDNSRRPCFL